MKDFLTQYKKARAASTPLLAISTPDPAATIQGIVKASGNGSAAPLIQWDCVSGAQGINPEGAKEIARVCKDDSPSNVTNPVDMLIIANGLEGATDKHGGSVLFLLNGHQYFDQPTFIQAFWNLRDVFSNKQCSAILLGPSFTMPPELQQDTLLLDEPLPNAEQLRGIVSGLATRNKIPNVTDETLDKAVDALRGLAAFPADSNVAMNASKKTGLDIDGMWDRKRQMIGAARGLSVYAGKETYDDIGSCSQVKGFMRGVIDGRDAPRAIIFLDEGEKIFGGNQEMSHSVDQDYLGAMLSYMEDNESDGAIFVGPPGAAKSAIAKATGNEAKIPLIQFDMNGMKAGLMGDSETNLRTALKVVTAVSDGRAFFIMTSNKVAALPAELKRRYTSGTFYFEIPDADSGYTERVERDSIWPIFLKKYDIKDSYKKVDDRGWTGAEIRNCCRFAYRQRKTLLEASQYIVPVSRSDAAVIERLRDQADGKYLSASKPGIYTKPIKLAQTAISNVGRQIAEEN